MKAMLGMTGSAIAVAALLGCGPKAGDAAQNAPSDPPATRPATRSNNSPTPQPPPSEGGGVDAPVAGNPATDTAVEALLDGIEADGQSLRTITARVSYEKVDALLGGKELRIGRLIYRADETGKRDFAILLESEIVNGQKRDSKTSYVFSDRWLAEIDHEHRQFIKREIAPPGSTIDPLALGEGPFPLPVGQKKAEVLKRFEAQPAALPGEGLLAKLDSATVDGLELLPRAGTPEADDFDRVLVFYDKGTRLPVGILMEDANGDLKTVRMDDVKKNQPLTDAETAHLSVENPDPKEWSIDIQKWRGENAE